MGVVGQECQVCKERAHFWHSRSGESQHTHITPATNNRTPWAGAPSLRATAWSRSTSCDGSSCASDPCPHRKTSNDAADDLAAAHGMIPYQRNLHACPTQSCTSRGSDVARALANNRTKILASSDHLPPAPKRGHKTCAGAWSNQLKARSLLASGELQPMRLHLDLRLLFLVRRRP